MKNGWRWIWVVVIVIGLFAVFYYLCYPFWPFHYWGNWPYRPFFSRVWFPFPFIGFFLLIFLGVILIRLLFSPSRQRSASANESLSFCPYCGKDLGSKIKDEGKKGDDHVSLPRA